MPAPMKPRLATAMLLIAAASLAPPGRHEEDHGTVPCESCGEPTRNLDGHGSYSCICGDALYVDATPPASATAKEPP